MLQHLANEDTAWRQDVNSDTLKVWWQFEMQCVFNNNYRYIFSSRGSILCFHMPLHGNAPTTTHGIGGCYMY